MDRQGLCHGRKRSRIGIVGIFAPFDLQKIQDPSALQQYVYLPAALIFGCRNRPGAYCTSSMSSGGGFAARN